MLTMTMDYFVRRALRRHADRVALVTDEGEVTYAELDRRSTALANALLGAGLGRGDRVAVLHQNSSEFYEAELATIKAGMVKVPVNPRLSTEEIVTVLQESGTRALFFDPEFREALSRRADDLRGLALLVSTGPDDGRVRNHARLASACDGPEPPTTVAPDDVYLVRFTGGTTGRPKGVMHTHASCVAIALAVVREYQFTAGDRFLQVAHLSHGQNFTWPALFAVGATVVVMRRFDPLAVLEQVARHRVTRINMVPTMVHAVLSHPRRPEFDLGSIHTLVYASAPMAVERIREVFGILGPRIVQVYTLSESAVITTMLRKADHVLDGPAHVVARLASCGREVLDVRLRIVDAKGGDVPRGEVGEITVASPGNMLGYWGQPELSAEVLRDGWVHTGDLAWQDDEGYVFLVDRKHDMINTGGFNVYPREVEEVLYQHPAVREAAVVGVPDDRWGEAIAAFVALRPEARCTEPELIEFCRTRLAGYKKPTRVEFLPDLPKSAVGKISRRDLREPFWVGRSRRIG